MRERLTAATRRLPDGWRQASQSDWLINIPPGGQIPPQGWKIHVSACLGNAEEILGRVWEYCVPRSITFKFLRGQLAIFVRNAKYASRGSSGKFITIYPVDEQACERILADLDGLLDGMPGPYILSDLRYRNGPLYVRYGSFTSRQCLNSSGAMVPAIANAAGELVPDVRSPVFTVPSWISLPDFLVPHLAARNAATIADLPYQIESALHFSNGGGVYAGVDKQTGERVLLKEARPHAGLAADGSDAVARLRREHDMLRRLSGLGVAPEARGYFQVGEHHFLVEDFIDGKPLNACYVERYPLTSPDPAPAAVAAYTSWAMRICAEVERAASLMHQRGVIFNDLHMFNIMVRPDDTVVFIDFEAAGMAGQPRLLTVGNPGFLAPRDRTGTSADTYSTACLRLAMFLPLTTLFTLDRGKAAQLATVIAEQFPVPREFLDEAVREITPRTKQRRGGETAGRSGYDLGWDALREALVRAIRASATPDRDDRLFPGDIEQFTHPGGGLCLAHGAAGVLFALAEAAGVRAPEYDSWLISRVAEPAAGSRLGCYDGLAGVAWSLSRLGHAGAALRTAEMCLSERWDQLGSDLYGGLPGFALTMLDLGDVTLEPRLTEAGLRAAELVAGRPAPTGPADPAGLLRGASGRALLFIRMYERTGDTAWLDAAEAAIAADLDRCVVDGKGALQVDDGWRTLPYLNAGSAGIGMVIDLFRSHRDGERFAVAAAKIRIAAQSGYYAQAGLFNGRAGMILYLAGHDRRDRHAAAHVRGLAWHAVCYAGGLAFPGDMLYRLSMDLGTGTAGVLLGVAAVYGPPAVLPFLGPAGPRSDQLSLPPGREPVNARR